MLYEVITINDAGALAQAIAWMFGNPEDARKMAEAGRESYLQDYSASVVIARYRQFFESVAAPAEAEA